MNEMVRKQHEAGLAISKDTEALIVSGVSGSTVKGHLMLALGQVK